MFGISGFELLIVIAFVLIIFGPDKLPELGRTIGRAIGTFKRAQEDMERIIRAEMYARDTNEAARKRDEELAARAAEEPDPAAQLSQAATIWAATDEDDEEEEDEE